MDAPVSDDARWRLLAILTTSYGAGAFGMLGISPLSPSLVEGLGLTRFQVAFIVPSIYLAGLLFSLPGGRLADRLTVGGVISALVLPAIAAALGWRYAVGACALVVALPVALGWRPLGALRAGGRTASPEDRGATGSSWWWARRPALVIFFATGFVLGMVQAAVLSYLPLFTIQALGFDKIGAGLLVAASQAGGAVSRLGLGAASDRWLTDRRSLWLTFTGAVGAAIFAIYAAWPATAPLAAGLLAFATGIGAYGWVGIFFVISAEAGGPCEAGLLSGVAFASIVLGLLVGPPVFGLLLETANSYTTAWAVFAGLSALVALVALLAGPAIDHESRR